MIPGMRAGYKITALGQESLKATQTRCTELLEQVRTLLACGYPIKETT